MPVTSISTEQLHCSGNKLNQFLNVAYYSAVSCHEYIKQLHWLVIKFFALNFAFKSARVTAREASLRPNIKVSTQLTPKPPIFCNALKTDHDTATLPILNTDIALADADDRV